MPSMTTAQEAAFRSANAGSLSLESGDVETMVASIAATLVFVWFAWLCVSAYQTLRRPGATVSDAGGHVARGLFVMIVLLALVTV